ncbi:MAG: shikimate kinase [Deltaproteobacteria bacterium]|nr:shikimate kinase [Deltaproteobacteria bacterium]
MKIVLIGFMGCGKSTIGRLLADRLGLEFLDLDARILQESGNDSINDIFKRGGESAFRQAEKQAAAALALADDVVIASGGGSILDPENVRAFKDNSGLVIYLRIDFDTAVNRVQKSQDISQRPLFKDLENARILFEQRLALYESCADLVIDSSKSGPDVIADEIERKLREIAS